MKNIVVLLWACVYWLLCCLGKAVMWTWHETFTDVETYIGTVTLAKAVAALCLGVTGIGMLGVFMAVMK